MARTKKTEEEVPEQVTEQEVPEQVTEQEVPEQVTEQEAPKTKKTGKKDKQEAADKAAYTDMIVAALF